MKKTIGILAHVDAGKTTFSEQLLYHMGVIRQVGRVDNSNTLLDSNFIEKKRGITIFSGLASFTYKDDTYYLIDTPGHVDFSTEMERCLPILDYAIVLIGGMAGIQSHTVTLIRLLQKYSVPFFLFINKIDQNGFDLSPLMEQISSRFEATCSSNIPHLLLCDTQLSYHKLLEQCAEPLAEVDEDFLECYLEEDYSLEMLEECLQKNIANQQLIPVCFGSALKNIGVSEFFDLFHKWTITNYDIKIKNSFEGFVYQIRHDTDGKRITFLKITSGNFHVKDAFFEEEKIHEIRHYNGERYENVSNAYAGDICAVTGFKTPFCGSRINLQEIDSNGKYSLLPALKAVAEVMDNTPFPKVLSAFHQLEAEDPSLTISPLEQDKGICCNIMGIIQLEVLTEVMKERFGIAIRFRSPDIQYQETISNPVMGYGHFEPLRHYAETNLLLEPLPKGSGIVFRSRCHPDLLAMHYQTLIRTHVFEKQHKGILTGSPLTDVKITLIAGRAHLKHTEGGDFREATYRAIRQGLEKADNVLLEPFYRFEIIVPNHCTGRVLSDLTKMSGTFEAPISIGEESLIQGRAPVSKLLNYPTDLASFSRGEGSITLTPDGYEPCHNTEEIIANIGYDKGADKENTSCSVFCSHGAGFVVNWDEAEKYMHCIER